MEAGQNADKPKVQALEDDELDSVSGGYYDDSIHTLEASAQLEDGTVLYQYFGIDTCSFCMQRQQTRFYQMTIQGTICVMCDTCYIRSSAGSY